MIRLERDGAVFVLRWDAGENRFGEGAVAAWSDALDEVDRAESPKALVTTGSGKFYSNGLDLDFMLREGGRHAESYLAGVLGLYARVLTLACPTVAALNGHAFGAGGQIALAHDFRVMREDRGFFCMPEIDMRAPLHPGMTAILHARLPAQTAHEVIATGRRYGGAEARAAGIVEHAVPEAEVLRRAVALAGALAPKAHPVMSRLKAGLYPAVLAALREPLPEAG